MKIRFIFLSVIFFGIFSINSFSAWRKITSIIPSSYINRTYLDVIFLKDNPNIGWACGYLGTVIKTTDGGKSWVGQEVLPGLDIQLESITFLNENVGYVSGPLREGLSGSRAYLLKSTNGGNTWFDVTPDVGNSFWGHYFIDENNGVLLGGECGFQIFWKTTDGGQNWSFTTANIKDSKMSDALLFDANGVGYAVGSGAFWKTENGGKNWSLYNSTGPGDWHEDIAIINNTVLLPVSFGCDGTIDENRGGIAVSNDLGQSWKRVATTAAMFGTFLHDDKRGWAVGFNRNILYTNDGGATWYDDNCGIPSGVSLDDILFLDDTTGWVVGNGVYQYYIPEYPKPQITAQKQFICQGDSVKLEIQGKYDRYIWNTGATTKTITVKDSGEYFVKVFLDSICFADLSNKVRIDYYPKKEVKFSYTGDDTPCVGDTITVKVNDGFISVVWFDGSTDNQVKVTESGVYSVMLTDSNGCTYSDAFQINFNPNPKPKINNLYRDNFCVGSETELKADDGYAQYEWYSEGSQSPISNAQSIKVNQSGKYFVKVIDKNGCEGISNLLSVDVRLDTNAFEFIFTSDDKLIIDSTNFNRVRCGNLKIINRKTIPQKIDDVYIFNNISFSAPLSQFPLMIGGNDSVNLTICFSPRRLGMDYDTLMIKDICSDHIIPIESIGITDLSNADSKCEVPLIFESRQLSSSFKASIYEPVPNPVQNILSVSFELDIPENEEIDINARLSDLTGNFIDDYSINVNDVAIIDNIKVVKGEILFDVSKLTQGYYLLYTKFFGNVLSYPVIIQK